ncbi:hypothetical protein CHS0354_012907 [Potamilus streckersoni]|uniref:DNA excision repair protein ERCC-6-like n=1 Tax=Potamilus streckersoni TaxID=2493646 RepID=A0AAE0W959_9BIVA|nr:hypothetical protein CHS0354_012907 [Potamilus streckersoni]
MDMEPTNFRTKNHGPLLEIDQNRDNVDNQTNPSSKNSMRREITQDDQQQFNMLVTKAKKKASEGHIREALELNKKALKIHSSEKLQKRIIKMEAYLKEYGDGSSTEEEDNGMMNLGNGFYIYKELYDGLYAHQKEGIKWLWTLYRRKKGGILGDDMGLGKTIQVIAFLSGMFDMDKIKSVLIVVPVSLLTNWEKEFTKWAPGICLTFYHGNSKKEKERALMKVQKRGGVCLTTYGTVVTSWEQLSQQDGKEFLWDYVILDEGHKIKNPTKTTKGVHAIGAKNRIILTGTPIQNNLRELWALFDFLHQGSLLGTARTFKMEYENPITRARERDATAGEKRLGMEMAESLKTIISPYFLRRTKMEVTTGVKTEPTDNDDDVADGLAELSLKMPSFTRKNDFIVWLSLTATQLKIYQDFLSLESVKELLMTNKSPLVALTVLKKICDHPRLLSTRACAQLGLEGDENIDDDILEAPEGYESAANRIHHIDDDILTSHSGKLIFLIKLLDQIKSEGHRCLIFSQSRKMLDIIEKVIKNRGHKIIRLDGTVTQVADREQRIRKFQSDDSYSVFLLTTQVGGVGITLTAADRVIIFDPNWNPATDAQAVDRAFRIGQEKNVIIYRLITCGTVEEKIYRRQIFKDSITRQTTGGSKNPYRYFSKYELRELFTLDDTYNSTTQQQLEQMHSGQRKSDTELDAHIAFLYSLNIVGLSDHDLMFSQEVKPDEEFEEEKEDGSSTTDYIQHRVQKAQEMIKMESELSSQIHEKASQYPRNIDVQPSMNTRIESEGTKSKRQYIWDFPKYIQAEPKLESDYVDLTSSPAGIKQEPGVKQEDEEQELASFHSAKEEVEEEEEEDEEKDSTDEVEQRIVNLSIVEYTSHIEDNLEAKRESHLQDLDSLKHEPHTPDEKREVKGHLAEHSTGSSLSTKKNIPKENATPRKQQIIEEEIIISPDAARPIVKTEPKFSGLVTSAQKNLSAKLNSALMTAFANNSDLRSPCESEHISFEKSPNLDKLFAKNLYQSMVVDSPLVSGQKTVAEFSPIVQVADSVENSVVLQKDENDTVIIASDDGDNENTDASVSDEKGANGENGSIVDNNVMDSPFITSKAKRVKKMVIESSEEEDEGSFEMQNKTIEHSDSERLAKSDNEVEDSAKEYYRSKMADTRQISRLESFQDEVTGANENDDNRSLTEQQEEEKEEEEETAEDSLVDEDSMKDKSNIEEEEEMEEEEVEDGFDNLPQEAKEMFNHFIDTGRNFYNQKKYEDAFINLCQALEIYADPELQQGVLRLQKKLKKMAS